MLSTCFSELRFLHQRNTFTKNANMLFFYSLNIISLIYFSFSHTVSKGHVHLKMHFLCGVTTNHVSYLSIYAMKSNNFFLQGLQSSSTTWDE